jgi:hypothetical protein
MMAISVLIWLLLAAFIIHNMEEYLTIDRAPEQMAHRVTRPQFGAALVAVTVLALVVAVTGTVWDNGPKVNFVLSLLPAMLVVNAVFHLGAAIYLRRYVPGLVTALCPVLPFSLYVLYIMAAEGLTNGGLIGLALVTALVLIYPIIRLALWLGSWCQRHHVSSS